MKPRRWGPNPICYAGRFLFLVGSFALLMLVAVAAAVMEAGS